MSFAGWVLFGCGIILMVGWCCFVMDVFREMNNDTGKDNTNDR